MIDTRPVATSREKQLTLLAAVLGTSVVFLDASVTGVALPAIRGDLGGGLAGQQWVTNAYLLALSSLIVYLGRDGYRDAAHPGQPLSPLASVYYATVTLSTTGYGDIVPVSDTARLINTVLITPIRVAFHRTLLPSMASPRQITDRGRMRHGCYAAGSRAVPCRCSSTAALRSLPHAGTRVQGAAR